jgi:hypothetical protein
VSGTSVPLIILTERHADKWAPVICENAAITKEQERIALETSQILDMR